jgi:hypothetical protein
VAIIRIFASDIAGMMLSSSTDPALPERSGSGNDYRVAG